MDKQTLHGVIGLIDLRLQGIEQLEDGKSAGERKGAYAALSNLRHDLVGKVETINHEEWRRSLVRPVRVEKR